VEGSRLPRASRTEILGQWLGLWTAPRDRYVPPPPVRKLVVWGGLAVAVAAVAVVIAANLVEDAKERRDARAARAQAALVARETARLRVDQAPRTGRASGHPSRAVLIGDLEHAIAADAASRHRRGLLPVGVESTSCAPFVRPAVPNPPQPPAGAREGKYECLALTGQVGGTSRSVGARVGYPFWARLDFRRSSWVYCKVNRRPGEMGTANELAFVPLVPACDLLR
jgi:hypothetical protein